MLPRLEKATTELFSDYKRRAKKKNLPFSLTREEFKRLIQMPCAHCGVKGSNRFNLHRGVRTWFKYSGLDRIDNNKGYTSENTVSSCKICNVAKASMSLKLFYKWVKRIHSKLFD